MAELGNDLNITPGTVVFFRTLAVRPSLTVLSRDLPTELFQILEAKSQKAKEEEMQRRKEHDAAFLRRFERKYGTAIHTDQILASQLTRAFLEGDGKKDDGQEEEEGVSNGDGEESAELPSDYKFERSAEEFEEGSLAV